jgi:UDP-N-acetylmuramoyl-L-alanyl-D-glutamate--2,6-diaminopimelate ligase
VGSLEVTISGIQFDSRKVQPGDLFVAVRGTISDGHAFIGQAIEKGVQAVVCDLLPETTAPGVTYLVVENTADALGHLGAAFYGNPSASLKLVAVTGTNGKTTTATLLYRLFLGLGYRAGLLSTIENRVGEEVMPATLTTPDALTMQQMLRKMVDKGCTHCFMEASSHAIHQGRMAGLELDGAIFSNITHDHLDYHKTFDNYIKAKKKLFDDLPPQAFALVNKDDRRGMVMLQNCRASHHTFAMKSPAEFKGRLIDNTFDGLLMEVDGRQVWFRLIGSFNAYNLLSIYAAGVLLGEDPEQVLQVLSLLEPARGRFEQVVGPTGIRGIVDYSHTPDALKNVLETIHEIKKPGEKVITVVGCGGDRDRTKRPKMAAIGAKFSDHLILTSDNPRSEDPEAIIQEMKAGVGVKDRRKTLSVTNRKEAIQVACTLAMPGDVLLVAGKGHENYQEIKGVKYDFDDKAVLTALLFKGLTD